MTQGRLGDACNTTHTTIQQLENGKRQLSERWLRVISKALGCAPSYLLIDGMNVPEDPMRAQAASILEDIPDEKMQAAVDYLRFLASQQD